MKPKILVLVGKRIRDIRKEKGLSQEQLAELAGFHFSYIGSIERADKNISLLNLQKIADALEVNVSDFLLYESNQTRSVTTKDTLYNEITSDLALLETTQLQKISLFIKEFIKKN